MQPCELSDILAKLKGASFPVLVTLLYLKRPVHPRELSQISKYSLRTVREVLLDLQYQDLVEWYSEDDEWVASDYAREAMAWLNDVVGVAEKENQNPSLLSLVEKKFPPRPCSRRSDINMLSKSHKKLPQPPPKPPPETKKKPKTPADSLPDDPQVQQAWLILLRTGVDQTKAVKAVQAAHDAGWDGEKIIRTVEGWLAYADTERGETIKHPGFVAAQRLTSLQEPPEVTSKKDNESTNRYVNGKYGHLIQH
jgi:hypothetical protein